jgi:hypothetical protein
MSKTHGSKKIHMAAIATMKWTSSTGNGQQLSKDVVKCK